MDSLVPEAVKMVLTNYANTEYEEYSRRLGADKAAETSQALAPILTLAAEKQNGSAVRHSAAMHQPRLLRGTGFES
jgi:hypothetical protein